MKQGVRYNTKVGYNFVLNLVKKEYFGYRQIRDIKASDAQQWIMKLQYVMGHFDVGVTLNVYTHASFDRAAEQMCLTSAGQHRSILRVRILICRETKGNQVET